MLLQVLDFIRRENIVSSQQLSREFRIDENALEPILNIWVKKGFIRVSEEKRNCKSRCHGCREDAPVYYQLVK